MQPRYFESLYPADTRSTEIEKIVGYIREGQSCQILGLPGVGRSNILGLLSYNKEVRLKHFPKHYKDVHFVMVNFSEVRNRTLFDVMKFLFLSLTTSLREREMMEEYVKIDTLFKDKLAYNDELVLTQGLKDAVDYLAIEKKLTLVFLFDRFDEYIPSATAAFFVNLRSLRDRAKYRFSVVFSLTRPLEESVEPLLLSDFSDFIVGHAIYLSLYDVPSVAFRLHYLEKLLGEKISISEKDELMKLTGGHLRLVKLAAESLLGQKEERPSVETFLLSQKTILSALQGIWRSLTPMEQLQLRSGTSEETESSYLERVGILHNGSLQIALLAGFIQALPQVESEKIVYDSATNTIRKGEVVLSDFLTKAEFRLLRLLLERENEVIERDEIIKHVWQEDRTTEGVTEQAVDQLVFRLRRKIEVDPNNPLHLLTIKGRGIKFTT